MHFTRAVKKRIRRYLSLFHTFMISRFEYNVKIGDHSIVYYKSSIVNYSRMGGVEIGSNCRIGCSPERYHAGMPFYTRLRCGGEKGEIFIGNNCRINGASIHAEASVSIGSNCVIASGVNIMDSDSHEVYSSNRTIGRDTPCPIIIGNNVWIGLNAIILKGAQVGDNSVIAAGSIVKGVFPNNSLIAGNPAVVIKQIDLKNN